MKLNTLLVILLSVVLSGCYTTYSGIYFLDRAQRPATDTFDDIAVQMTAVLEPFGFRREQMPQGMDDMILFSHGRINENDRVQAHSGEGAHISVTIHLRGPSITIRDYDNDKETDFTREIKGAIEKRLQEHYQLKGLKFERQVDILV